MRCFAVSIHTVHHRKLLPMCSRGSYGLQCVYMCMYALISCVYIYVFVCLDICMQTHRKYNFGMCIAIQYMHNLHTDTSAHQKLTHTHIQQVDTYIHTCTYTYIQKTSIHTYDTCICMYVCMCVCMYIMSSETKGKSSCSGLKCMKAEGVLLVSDPLPIAPASFCYAARRRLFFMASETKEWQINHACKMDRDRAGQRCTLVRLVSSS